MDLFTAICSRRSIRKYTNEQIPDEALHKILECANQAPSANNGRPWEFIIVTKPALLEAISKINANWRPVQHAGVCIVVVANLQGYPCSHMDFYMQDCAACTENLLLAAHALGLGAVWMGCCPAEDRMDAIRKVLHIPAEIMPFAVVPIGYPKEKPCRTVSLPPEIIHRNCYLERE